MYKLCRDFLTKEFPSKGEKDEPDRQKREEFNTAQKKKRNEKIEVFVKPGNPGAKFKKTYEKMLAKLELPKHVKEQLGVSQVPPAAEPSKEELKDPVKEDVKNPPAVPGTIPEEAEGGKDVENIDYKTLLQNGRYYLIPSFFSMIRSLKKAKREFAIVFRSFGSDLKGAVAEFNAYSFYLCPSNNLNIDCVKESTHALTEWHQVLQQSSMGQKGTKIIALRPIKQLCTATTPQRIQLWLQEPLTKYDSHPQQQADNKNELEDYYAGALEEGTVAFLNGVQEIQVNLLDSLQKVCSYAIQDDFSYWNAKKKTADSGKLLLIDDADYETQQIFFDDNIRDDPNDTILDVRDSITGEVISYKRAINKFFVRVESDRAILENDYFVKKIDECEKRRTEEIENMEKGISLEEEIVETKKVDEWAVLQQLGTNEYLARTVLPVVYQGLKEVDIERPKDPVKSFAFFLLKNQGLVKLPEKKPEPEEPKQVIEEVKVEQKNEEPKVLVEEKKVEAKKEQKKKQHLSSPYKAFYYSQLLQCPLNIIIIERVYSFSCYITPLQISLSSLSWVLPLLPPELRFLGPWSSLLLVSAWVISLSLQLLQQVPNGPLSSPLYTSRYLPLP
eukprot:TRINITY_DN1258_c0_g1_i1.p1 TRINITY_DN1258_c0_g1~~TRINITY_DN1258_c0_g1_i1.p1  ORF type:complete len:615 (+),score=67.56 TRINITY_DN1258_c0_g1_i1:2162-4006(+)